MTLLLSKDVALGYGMPHIGCRYKRDEIMATAFDGQGVTCVVCGAAAVHRHHEPPRSMSRCVDPGTNRKRPGSLLLETPRGMFVLKPALIALCAKCHRMRHDTGLLEFRWRFDRPEYEEMWLDGTLLSRPGIWAHSEALYGFGAWNIANRRMGTHVEYRPFGY